MSDKNVLLKRFSRIISHIEVSIFLVYIIEYILGALYLHHVSYANHVHFDYEILRNQEHSLSYWRFLMYSNTNVPFV